jgi:hypothetical protein
MNLKLNWRQLRAKNMAIEQVESRLQTVMHPVAPPAGYVQDLGRRLRHKTGSLILIPQPAPRQYTWLLFLSLLSGGVLVVLGVRALLGLIGALGVAQQVKNQMDNEYPSSLNPAG